MCLLRACCLREYKVRQRLGRQSQLAWMRNTFVSAEPYPDYLGFFDARMSKIGAIAEMLRIDIVRYGRLKFVSIDA